MSRLGGITYGRSLDLFELPRPDFEKDVGGHEAYEKLAKAAAMNGTNETTNGTNGA